MNVSKSKFLTTCAATVLLAVALSACGGGDGPVTDGDDMMPGDGMMPEPQPEPDPQALANAVDLVANEDREDDDGEPIGGQMWRWRDIGIGKNIAITMTHREGEYVNAVVWHDTHDNLQHDVSLFDVHPVREANPSAQFGRYVSTGEEPRELVGVTSSARSVSDHGLGSEWQVTELSNDYDGGGTLTIYVATDVQPSDNSMNPFQGSVGADRNITLAGAPALAADRDFIVARILDGENIDGSLGGVEGTFSCANAEGCVFIVDRRQGDYYNASTGVTFTSSGGTTQQVDARINPTVPAADYLAFGHWLHVPEDVTDMDAYDFGVYASGGDPFETTNLAGLTGTATYEGDAVGMYYVDGLSSSPDVGAFTADVALTADFGDGSATGFIDGEVNNFMFEGDVASSLPATVTLASRTWPYLPDRFGVPQGSTNIFDTSWRNADYLRPGGHIGGVTEADVDGEDWGGQWHGVFYGNGASPTDHPTSVAGVFGTSMMNDYNRSGNGLTGSFGAHRQ